MKEQRKQKERCFKCQSPDLRYSSGPLFKTAVRCGSCGASWSDGRTSKARRRYAKEIYSEPKS